MRRQRELGHGRAERRLVLGVQVCERFARLCELPCGAIARKGFQACLTRGSSPASCGPRFGLSILDIAVAGERLDPTIAIAVGDMRGNVKDLSCIKAAGGSPAEGGCKEQIHV